MIRVLIVDDHAILRRGLIALLSDAFEGVQCGEASSAKEGMEQLRKHEWDVVLLDITMPGKSGLDLLKELKAEWPKLPVLVLSVHPEDQFAARVRKAGGEGYMTKESAPEELVKAIRKILAGGRYVSPALAANEASALRSGAAGWLAEDGPRELELLLRCIIYHPSKPLLILDNQRHCQDASIGAAKLLGMSRSKIIGRRLDEFVDVGFKSQVGPLWAKFLQTGAQKGTLKLDSGNGISHEVEYDIKANILPGRELLVLHEMDAASNHDPAWAQDYALLLLNKEGTIATWYAGSERIYGYSRVEAIGQPGALLYPSEDILRARLREELKRAEVEGYFGNECWCLKKDGTLFWANVVTVAVKNDIGELQGFARVVRDFSERHQRDQDLRASALRLQPKPAESTLAGIVSGEFDHILEANDAFLDLLGYSRKDMAAGLIRWPSITSPEYWTQDEAAQEEALIFRVCTPYKKEFIGKDGTRVPVLVATAVLKLQPFCWICLVQEVHKVEVKAEPKQAVQLKDDFNEIVGRSHAVKRTLALIEVVAPTSATVLILGETGTGKELVARAVHRMSPRRDRPFITLNCAAIPTGLLESELFGYERGAFTGALSQKIGRFERAHHGTLFLDEVGDIPLDLQPKLLRALQEKAFERLGGTKTIPIDVRLVAATNRNLTEMVGDKLFRSDLYYRLKVFPITSSPLRDRPGDIPVLVWHFVQKYALKMKKQIDEIPPKTMQALVNWPWPGNVRELENFMERSVILSQGSSLDAPLEELLPESLAPAGSSNLDQVERAHIIKVLRESNGEVSRAAIRLGMPRTTLNATMKKLAISRAGV